MSIIKIRYNTEHNGSRLKWRVIMLPSWDELLVENVIIKTVSCTTEDILPDGRVKNHITVEYSSIIRNENYLVIE